jgi:serine phosphatase RsbU (regulator of sigma subunit)
MANITVGQENPGCVRLVVGDAKGKGLPAVQSAAAVLSVFREAAHEEDSLAAIVSRIEISLARQLTDEQFVTAILAEVSADGTKVEPLSCGHPAPLLLGAARPRFTGPEEGSLPLGLGHLGAVPRIPVTIPFERGDALLLYTDGASEARNKAGTFFPLADCAAVRAPPDPATLADRLGDEVIGYTGHAPDDDVALLVVYRDGSLPARTLRPRRDEPHMTYRLHRSSARTCWPDRRVPLARKAPRRASATPRVTR